jgi:hypothetical protein
MRWAFPALARAGIFQAVFARIFPRMAFGTTQVRLAF